MTGAQLYALRKLLGLSQARLAERAGVTRQAVSTYENRPVLKWWNEGPARCLEVLLICPPSGHLTRALMGDQVLWVLSDAAREFEAEVARFLAAADRSTARVSCGARTRNGTPCRAKSEPGKSRCRLHGGLSTGPKTVEGRDRIAEAQRRRWAKRKASDVDGGSRGSFPQP